jgi:hypothetical protein
MIKGLIAAAVLGCSCAATFSAAMSSLASGYIPPPPEPVSYPYEVIAPRDFQVFVNNWSSPRESHCVAIRSAAEWERNLHPAATMGSHRPFAPPPAFWRDHIVLLIARSMPMGNLDDAIHVSGVSEIAGRLEVQLAFHPVDSSATMNDWRGIVIGRPDWLHHVSFKAGSESVCTLETSSAGQ